MLNDTVPNEYMVVMRIVIALSKGTDCLPYLGITVRE